jgi:hypothetical protein
VRPLWEPLTVMVMPSSNFDIVGIGSENEEGVNGWVVFCALWGMRWDGREGRGVLYAVSFPSLAVMELVGEEGSLLSYNWNRVQLRGGAHTYTRREDATA